LFSQPLSPTAWFVAVSVVRYAALIVPLVVVMVALGLYGQVVMGQVIPWPFLGRALAVSAALLAAFVGIGLAIATRVRHPARVITYVILTWALAVALLDVGLIGVLLKWRIDARAVFTLAAANPVQDARMALLSGLEPDLANLGPVGFYLAHTIGGTALYVLGVAWPAVVGLTAWSYALFSFRRTDLV
jgi:ABC-2 type transport system permease protein